MADVVAVTPRPAATGGTPLSAYRAATSQTPIIQTRSPAPSAQARSDGSWLVAPNGSAPVKVSSRP